MRAAVCSSYGPPEAVTVETLPSPLLEPGQVRIKIGAAAVNFSDVLLIADKYQVSVPPPFTPGSEFAGVVEEVAEGVSAVSVGDRVTGTGFVGAFAEEIVVASDKLTLKRIPDGIDAHVAAAFGVAHRTAYHTLRSVARLRPGDELIVLGAGGGVGIAAVQLGIALGASVTAVASSTDKLVVAASYGAGHLIDHRSGDLRTRLKEALPQGADVVVDPVGGDLSEPALRALRPGGRFVTVGYASGVIPSIPLNLVLVKGIHISGFQFKDIPADEFHRNEQELTDLLLENRAVPHIGASYPLEDTADALRLVADGNAIGKVLIDCES
ncbi:NADPH:quinone oxidoreductase family protein [Rhodococcus sp. NPDC019627]|uniref:NADPH:quinone oxidoreductase family protein n=1 Tax=unclassified Rhodococcus (in: high G+C Gram-positive bacteria) TaxID=192944 RepID=UPI0033F581CC